MKRIVRPIGALVCALSCAVSLCGAPVASAGTLALGSASGTVSAIDGTTFTIETAGPRIGVINALTDAANRITEGDYPYVWGGGHGLAGVASIGINGPGYNGRTVGFDCSGSVAAVLAGAGLWPAGGGVPNDAGVIAELRQQGLIARGAGTAPDSVTLYDDPGVHIFMNIDGRFFGTSDGGGGGNRKGGAGWLYDGAWDSTDPAFKKWHFLPSVLHDRTSYGHLFTFVTGGLSDFADPVAVGDAVKIAYSESKAGVMLATTITYLGAVSATGTLGAISANGSSLTVDLPGGETLILATGGLQSLLDGLTPGDTVTVTYTKTGATLTAHGITIVSAPATPPSTPTTPVTTPGPPPSSDSGASRGGVTGGAGDGSGPSGGSGLGSR